MVDAHKSYRDADIRLVVCFASSSLADANLENNGNRKCSCGLEADMLGFLIVGWIAVLIVSSKDW